MPSFQTIQDLSPDDRTLVQSILARNARDRSRNEVDILAARASVINNRVVLNDPDNYIALASGNTIPDGMSGFAKEALFIESDAANGTVRLYANSGDESQANFKPIGFPTNGLTLVNTTGGNTISVDQNGNTGTNIATDGAIHIENTGNTGIGLGVYTNAGAEANSALVIFKAENTAFDQGILTLVNDGAGRTLWIDSNATDLVSGVVLIQDPSTVGGNQSVKIESARTGGLTVSALEIEQAGSASGIFIDHNGNGVGLNLDTESTTVDSINVNADTLTTGSIARFASDSASTGTRSLIEIVNDNALAVNVTPLFLKQDAPTNTNYFKIASLAGVTLWIGNGNTANAVLSGTAGDIIFNAGSNKPEYCTGTTNWVALV